MRKLENVRRINIRKVKFLSLIIEINKIHSIITLIYQDFTKASEITARE